MNMSGDSLILNNQDNKKIVTLYPNFFFIRYSLWFALKILTHKLSELQNHTTVKSWLASLFSMAASSLCSVFSLSTSAEDCVDCRLALNSSIICLVFASIIDICVLVSPSRCCNFILLSPLLRSMWPFKVTSCGQKSKLNDYIYWRNQKNDNHNEHGQNIYR